MRNYAALLLTTACFSDTPDAIELTLDAALGHEIQRNPADF